MDTRCRLSVDLKTTRPPTQPSTRRSSKARRTPCDEIPSKCPRCTPSRCVSSPTTRASGFFHCMSLPSNLMRNESSTFTQFLMSNRPHRVAFASRSRCDLHRGSFADPGACQGRLPAVHYRPMHVAKYPRVGQRRGPLGPLRPHWPTERPIPAKQRLARQGHRCHVRVCTILLSSLLSVRHRGG
jgi:hypothetical protein